ncbi:inositol monophosphatase family protein [Solidesulfovibrio sp.]|uniref:inositol monophosphatase family protein n=1 Tax=Solidesulfovibrio sp. TaxID=2910990 RepID=UPI00261BC7BF|nr:inositol monophosphatase family protein [Solidesulfovibrio sp.]
MLDLQQAQLVAATAARRAGALINKAYAARAVTVSRVKSPGDLATETDARAERIIRDHLRDAYPDHAVLGEEEGQRGDSPCRWIVDPLDGTMNFVHGLPYFAVSLALEIEGRVRLAVVHDPVTGGLYTAREGGGAYRNGRIVRVSTATDLASALIGTVAPPPTWPEMPDFLRRFGALCRGAAGVRRMGAAALDLAGVAGGRLDGFFVMNLKLWDVAAGGLLVTEAGGLVAPLPGVREEERGVRIVAGAPGVMEALLRVLA